MWWIFSVYVPVQNNGLCHTNFIDIGDIFRLYLPFNNLFIFLLKTLKLKCTLLGFKPEARQCWVLKKKKKTLRDNWEKKKNWVEL